MKRIVTLVVTLFILLAFGPATLADDPPYKVYLPIVSHSETMSDWKIIVPEATTNKALNPSAETTGNFAAVGGTVTRSTTYSKYGLNSYRVQTAADDQGMTLTLQALANATHYVTLLVRGTLPAAWDWSLDGSTFHAPTLIEALDDNWSLYGYQFPNTEANGSTTLRIYQNGAGSGDFYIDGVQVEEKDHWTTYCDGNQSGCAWNGSEHASTSTRSAMSRAGGRIYDLQTDYHLDIGGMAGTGAAPQRLNVDPYAILPGGQLNNVKTQERVFTLTGVIRGTSMANLHANKQALLEELSPDKYPPDQDGFQPVRLRYTGAAVQKQIAAHYETGLEGDLRAEENYYWERVAIRFIADDPYWYEVGESAVALDTNDSATLRYTTGRLKSAGQWGDLGLTANPTTGGTVYAIAAGNDRRIYVGGNFTGWNGQAGWDYIVAYSLDSSTWERVGGASDLNGMVRSLALAPDGRIIVGGGFTNAGGVADADYVAAYDPSTNSFDAIAAGGNGTVLAIAIGTDGTIYLGGSFANWASIGAADYIVSYDGSSWAALGSGMDNDVDDLAINPLTGHLFAAGNFGYAGGLSTQGAAEWDGSSWTALNPSGLSGSSPSTSSVAISNDGRIYFSGKFTAINGVSANNIAMWNGSTWYPLGSGINGTGLRVRIGPDGIVFVSGVFTSAGGILLADRVAAWNGATWLHLDANLPGSPNVWALAISDPDPVIVSNYDLWLGFDTTGSGSFAGLVTATNDSTAPVYPKIIIGRSGGTSAALESVRNEATGKVLLFNYSLLDGETLTIDLTPTQKSIVSNFFGPRPDAILPNCDFGTFTLQPGDNDVSAFVNVAGGPTITAWMEWQDAYKSQD
jgi:hypothetical protein